MSAYNYKVKMNMINSIYMSTSLVLNFSWHLLCVCSITSTYLGSQFDGSSASPLGSCSSMSMAGTWGKQGSQIIISHIYCFCHHHLILTETLDSLQQRQHFSLQHYQLVNSLNKWKQVSNVDSVHVKIKSCALKTLHSFTSHAGNHSRDKQKKLI
jgi:hypothetical protein